MGIDESVCAKPLAIKVHTQQLSAQQHPLACAPGAGWFGLMLASPPPPGWAPCASGCESISRVLMSRASVKKASSTPSLTLALVSRKRTPSSSARAWPCSCETAFFSVQSHLLPMRILLTPSEACCSMLECHVRISDMRRARRERDFGKGCDG